VQTAVTRFRSALHRAGSVEVIVRSHAELPFIVPWLVGAGASGG
jgi:hypothetical protein